MADHSLMKHGKQPARHDDRTLLFENYWLPGPPPAQSVDWGSAVHPDQWGMMENNNYEDCTCAAAAHLIMAWTANVDRFQPVPTNAVIDAYAQITGFNPETGAHDKGAVVLDVLKFWRTAGIGGHKIVAFVEVPIDPDTTKAVRFNEEHMRIVIGSFVGTYVGLQLPKSAMTQDVWGVPAGDGSGDNTYGSWQGHAVCIVGYDANTLTAITWGVEKKMTWHFLQTYCDEAYALLSRDYLKDGDIAPQGIKLTTLYEDLKKLGIQTESLLEQTQVTTTA